jgi:hypothetical protein
LFFVKGWVETGYYLGADESFSGARQWNSFAWVPICGKLACMGSKDKGRKEAKKAPKPKPKPEPGQKREVFTPAPPK